MLRRPIKRYSLTDSQFRYYKRNNYRNLYDGSRSTFCVLDSKEFMVTREGYIAKKQTNPTLILKNAKDLWPERIVHLQKERSNTLHKPKRYLMELTAYNAKFGKADPSLIVTKTFHGKEIRGVMVQRDADVGMWEVDEAESSSVAVRQQAADLLLSTELVTYNTQIMSLCHISLSLITYHFSHSLWLITYDLWLMTLIIFDYKFYKQHNFMN